VVKRERRNNGEQGDKVPAFVHGKKRKKGNAKKGGERGGWEKVETKTQKGKVILTTAGSEVKKSKWEKSGRGEKLR